MNVSADDLKTAATALGAGLVGLFAGFKRLRVWNSKQNVAAAGAAGELSVLTLLREEVERLASQNQLLADGMNKLQLHYLELQGDYAELSGRFDRSEARNSSLQQQLDEVRAELRTYRDSQPGDL